MNSCVCLFPSSNIWNLTRAIMFLGDSLASNPAPQGRNTLFKPPETIDLMSSNSPLAALAALSNSFFALFTLSTSHFAPEAIAFPTFFAPEAIAFPAFFAVETIAPPAFFASFPPAFFTDLKAFLKKDFDLLLLLPPYSCPSVSDSFRLSPSCDSALDFLISSSSSSHTN